MRRAVALAVTLSVTTLLPLGDAGAGDPAAAEVLFQQGRAASDKGDVATACVKFRESNRLDPAVGTVFNIGDCEEKLGRLATAWQLFREVIQRLPGTDERVSIAKQRATALEKRVPRLTVHLATGAPPGTKVTRDGVELGEASLDVALPVDPGEHAVEVTAPGRKSTTTRATLAESEAKTLEVRAGEAGATRAAASGEPSATGVAPSDGKRTAGWVIGGAGVASLVVGGVTGILVLGKKSTVDGNCTAAKRCNQTGLDAADSGKTLGTVSGIALALGVVGVGIGTWLIVSSSGDKQETAVSPTFVPGGGGFAVRSTF